MGRRQSTVPILSTALGTGILAACGYGGTPIPTSIYGTIESRRLPAGDHDVLIAGLRRRIKHVFVIFQENHSFDNYFGTYPGSENLGTKFAKNHGLSQYDPIANREQSAFRITLPDTLAPQQYRYVLENKFDGGRMDRFISAEEQNAYGYGYSSFVAHQYGLTTMAVYDCDTIPYLWKYASNFALFDHYFQAETGESSPSALVLFAGQSGISQEHRFPDEASTQRQTRGVPVINDMDPFLGPYTRSKFHRREIAQSYATLGMLLGGADSAKAAAAKPGKVRKDLATIAVSQREPIPWAWDQEGYVDSRGGAAPPGYEAHHNAPQYFDYIRLNSTYWSHLGTAQQELADINSGALPDEGVYFVKGSSLNEFGWRPARRNALVQKYYLGDDDHPGPGDSDAQVGEAFVATFVNAIARSKYWNDSAILVTWDDGGGFFDHVPPRNWEECNDGFPCGDGQRLPFILISPFARSGAVVTDYSDTASVSKFVEAVFHLPSMASLPDEAAVAPFGPRDDVAGLSDLAGAFDPNRLNGQRTPIEASKAEIPDGEVGHFPPAINCASLHVHPIPIPARPKYYDPLKTLKSYSSRPAMPEPSGD